MPRKELETEELKAKLKSTRTMLARERRLREKLQRRAAKPPRQRRGKR